MKRKPKTPGIEIPPKPDHPAWEKCSRKTWAKKWREAVEAATRPVEPPPWVLPSSPRGRSSSTPEADSRATTSKRARATTGTRNKETISRWTPRAFNKREREAILAHVRPKFKDLVDDVRRLERDAIGAVMFGPFPVALKRMSKRALTYHLSSIGFDKSDAEELVEKHLATQEYIRKRERGIYAILRDWKTYFSREMAGVRIAEVTGRTVTPRWESARFPRKAAARITAKLMGEFCPEYKVTARTILEYFKKISES